VITILPLLILSVLAGLAIAIFVWRQIASESSAARNHPADADHRTGQQDPDRRRSKDKVDPDV
jgi:hypothetical protein